MAYKPKVLISSRHRNPFDGMRGWAKGIVKGTGEVVIDTDDGEHQDLRVPFNDVIWLGGVFDAFECPKIEV